jgi:hydrogenase maturation protease
VGVVTARILIAGVGNIFLGDDGFGPEVIRHLAGHFDGDDSVRVADYGIGGMHLAYDLLDGWSALVLVDALPNRGSPGSLHMFDADHDSLGATSALDAHGMDPAAVFGSLSALGGTAPRTIVVGCESLDVAEGIGLSEPLRAALPAAVRAVQAAVALCRPAVREA